MSTLPDPTNQPGHVVVVDSRPLWRLGLCRLLRSELGMPVEAVEALDRLPADTNMKAVVVSAYRADMSSKFNHVCIQDMADVSDLVLAVRYAARDSSTHVDGAIEHIRPLTERERSVLRAVGRGLLAAEIGDELGISARTVERHRQVASAKLGARSPAQAVALAATHTDASDL